MAPAPVVNHLPILLRADATRVVLRPFTPADDPRPIDDADTTGRAQALANRVLALADADIETELARVVAEMCDRHPKIEDVLLRRFHQVDATLIATGPMSRSRQLLIGAYFSEEYAFEAAALFNPSIVAHPDQSHVAPGALRFVLSMRGVGEGHISSITFRTGTILADASIVIDPVSPLAITPHITILPGDDCGVRLSCEYAKDLSEIVIFPITLRQSRGIEDLRLVRFVEDDGSVTYLGTYTACGSQDIREELLQTGDFATFTLEPLRGAASPDKGMALFPRRIGGRYATLGRLDHENIWLLYSDDLHCWEGGTKVLSAKWMWEFVQMGNCGCPIEIDEGWLVLIHGVGPVRNYCVGACLLDKADPSKVIRRLAEPLLRPDLQDRDGYVPNVIYSCGALVNGRTLILPYAVADSFTTFATMSVDDLLAAMGSA